jgi:hypothetical protein
VNLRVLVRTDLSIAKKDSLWHRLKHAATYPKNQSRAIPRTDVVLSIPAANPGECSAEGSNTSNSSLSQIDKIKIHVRHDCKS